MHFWYICIIFSIFNVISEEFKFSKVFLILQSSIFSYWVDVDIARFKNTKKNNKKKIKIEKRKSWGTSLET